MLTTHSTPAEDHSDAVDRLTSCIIRVRDWMARNRLKLNEEKTQVIWLGRPTRQQLDKVMVQTLELQNATVPFSSVVNDLGVLFDSELTMANQIAALGRSCFFHLRRLRSLKQSLTPDANKTLVHAFVSNRLDCCNSLLAGVSNQLLQRLQVVQNAAARLVTGARRSEHTSPILRDLYWLPVRQRIVLKTAVLAYKCQHDMAPEYLQVYCQPTSAVACRRLRSAESGRLAVPCTMTSYGDRSFAVQGPRLWNSLPAELRKERNADLYSAYRHNDLKALRCGSHRVACKYTTSAFPSYKHSLEGDTAQFSQLAIYRYTTHSPSH